MVIEKIWLQATQPLNTSVLWLDTSGAKGILKMFFKGSWIPVSDESEEIDDIVRQLQELADTVAGYSDSIEQISEGLDGKVDKVQGKQLSTNDLTDELLEKLNGIEEGAQKNTVTSVAGKTGEVSLTKSDVGLGNVTNDAQVKRSEMGAANGVATLDANGKLVTSQIPEEVVEMLSYGVEWDTSVSNPACTRVGNPLLHKSLPIQSALKGCIAVGKDIKYYLNPNDWTQKADGSGAAKLDGTDGYVRVHSPKFYARSFINGTKRQVRFSTVQIDPTWIEIPEMLIDAYKPTIDRTNGDSLKLASVVNTSPYYRGGGNRTDYDDYLATDPARSDLGKPVTGLTRAVARTYARNAGSELMCYEYYKWILYWMFVIEYATFNSQAPVNNNLTPEGYHQGGLGNGISTMGNWDKYNDYYPITPCGATNALGNFSGEVAVNIPAFTYMNGKTEVTVAAQTLYANRYRGIENPFGDVWTNLDGIIIDADCGDSGRGDNLDIVYTTTDPNAFGETLTDAYHIAGHEFHQDGYIGEFDLGETGEIIPSSVDGRSTSKKCDYHWTGGKDTTLRALFVGGAAANGASAGLGYFGSKHSVGYSYADIGFRSITVID